jgi:hypothetical protein
MVHAGGSQCMAALRWRDAIRKRMMLRHIAMLLFLPLLFVACAYGIAEQLEGRANAAGGAADGTDARQGPPPFDAPGLNYRERAPRE